EVVGGGLQIGLEKGGVMAVARGVEADADADQRAGAVVGAGVDELVGMAGVLIAGRGVGRCADGGSRGVVAASQARGVTWSLCLGTRHGQSPKRVYRLGWKKCQPGGNFGAFFGAGEFGVRRS